MTSPPGAAAPLRRDPDFRLYWLARSVSILGDRVTELALPWLVLLETGSALSTGLVIASGQLPLLVFGLPAGVLADRWDRRTLMVCADLLRGVALGALVAAALAGGLRPWQLALAMFALGCGSVLFNVAAGGLLPALVGRSRLPGAYASLEAADAASTLAGPALGGALVQLIGPARTVAVDAVSFFVSALALARLRYREACHAEKASQGSRWRQAFLGATYIWRVPQQRVLLGANAALNAFSGAVVLLLVALTQRTLGLDAGRAGLVFAAAGVGGLAASALVPRLSGASWGVLLGGALAVMAAACLALALAGGFWAALGGNLLLDGAAAFAFVVSGSARGALTPDRLLGRVTAASYLLNAGVRGLGAIAAGAAVASLGARGAFATSGFALLFVAAAVSASRSARAPLEGCEPVISEDTESAGLADR